MFELLVKMEVGGTGTMLRKSPVGPRYKLKVSHEIGIEGKALDGHIAKPMQFSLVEVVAIAGTCRVYSITQKGKMALDLVEGYERGSRGCT